MVAFELRDFAGGAADTTLAADITSGATAATLAAAVGWPSGGAAGPFGIAIGLIDPVSKEFVSNVEKIRVGARTGTSLSSMVRGQDGTTALAHVTGETVRHIWFAEDADEANTAVVNTVGKVTTKGDLLAATGANALDRRSVGTNDQVLVADSAQATGLRWDLLTAASLGTDSVGADEIAAGAVGNTELATDAVTQVKVANDAIGTAEILNLAVTAGKIATDTITAAQIAADAIGTSELAPDAVTAAEIAANAVGASELADNAVDTAAILDAAVTLAKFASEAATDWSSTLTFDNVVLGTGGSKWAHHAKLGRVVLAIGGFKLGTGGDVIGELSFNLPFTAAKLTPAGVGHRGGLVAARTVGGASSASGLGAIDDASGKVVSIISAFQSTTWGQVGDGILDTAGALTVLDFLVVYIATS